MSNKIKCRSKSFDFTKAVKTTLKLRFAIILFCTLIVAVSCKKDKTKTPEDYRVTVGRQTFGVYLNGQPWVANYRDVGNGIEPISLGMFDSYLPGLLPHNTYMWIRGLKANEEISLYIPAPLVVGRKQLNITTFPRPYILDPPAYGMYYVYSPEKRYMTNEIVSGYVDILRVDTLQGKIEGKFEYNAINSSTNMQQFFMAILIALATALPYIATAQTSFFAENMDRITQHVDKSPITSGYLYDRSMPQSRFDAFNNATDTTDFRFANQVYMELYQAAFSPTRMTTPSLLYEMMATENHRNRIPIQILDYEYQQIKPTAIEDELLKYVDGQLYNTAGNPNPFTTKHLQLTTLLAEKITSPIVTFTLMPHFISRNTGLNVTQVTINGNGFTINL
jgi:hypothetical protein